MYCPLSNPKNFTMILYSFWYYSKVQATAVDMAYYGYQWCVRCCHSSDSLCVCHHFVTVDPDPPDFLGWIWDSTHVITQTKQTCFLFVANTFLDALSTGDDPKKSSADVGFS